MADLVVRLRALRLMSGRTQKEMAEFLDVAIPRIKALEGKTYRMVDDEIVAVARAYPNMLRWFILGEPVIFDDLQNSDSPDEQIIAAMIKANRVAPELLETLNLIEAA